MPRQKRSSSINILAVIALLVFMILGLTIASKNKQKAPKIIRSSNTSIYLYETKNNSFSAKIGNKNLNSPVISFDSAAGTNATFSLVGSQSKSNTQKENSVIYENIFPDTDLIYTPLVNGIKEEIIIDKPVVRAEYIFNLSTNAHPREISSEFYSPFFFDENNNYQFHLEKPFAVDANGKRTDDILLSIRKSKENENSYQIKITVPPAWLNSKDRKFPVIVDPTIVYDTSTEFAAGILNRSFDTGSGSYPSIETYYQELVSDANTAGLWHFNETSDNTCSGGEDLCDSSGNSNHGTATGTTITTSDKMLGSAARVFNGTSDFINVGNDSSLPQSGDVTLETWFKTSDVGVLNMFASFGTTNDWLYWFGKDTSDYFHCKAYRANSGNAYLETATTITVADGKWHHGACVITDEHIQLYIDGELAGSTYTPAGTRDVSTAGNLYIGKFDWSTTYNMDGNLDEFRISNIARTPEEIKADASRRPYSTYTSDVIDFGNKIEAWNSFTWNELGVATGDGETLKDSTGLVAQWNFNETTGTTADNAEGTAALDGTLSGFDSTASQDADPDSTWTANERRWGAGALKFDGVDSYVSVTDNNALDLTTAGTVEVWFNRRTIQNYQMLLTKGDGANPLGYQMMDRSTDGRVVFRWAQDSDTLVSTQSIPNGQWTHLVGVYDGSYVYMYINGKLETSKAWTTDAVANALPLRIGARSDGFYYNGIIDSVRVYNRAATAAEIMSNYNAGNIELQTRVGATTTPDDGTWEAWKPTTGETSIYSFDSSESTQWGYRKQIDISHTGTAVTEYQVLVDGLDTATLISGGKMQTDCDDIRFTNSSGTLLHYSIVGATCNTSDTKIWVKVDSIPDSGGATIYLFYGNPNAPPYTSDVQTFGYSSEKTVGYILDNQVNQLELISLNANNSITHNSVTRELNRFDTSNFSSISQFGTVSAKSLFNADDASDDTDLIVPVSWAGTNFYYYARASYTNLKLNMIAPWSTATVTVYENGSAVSGCTSFSVTSAGATKDCTIAAANAIHISSDVPILVFSEADDGIGNFADGMPVHPATTQKWIGGGSGSWVVNGTTSMDWRWIGSTVASEQDPADLAADTPDGTSITSDSGFGGGAVLVRSAGSTEYGVMQAGDGDGGDSHFYNDFTEMGTYFGSANQADYISIASDQAATCTVREASDRTLVGTGTASSSNSSIYHLGFGTGNSTAYTAGAWEMSCDKPVVAHYQKATQAEANLMHYPMMRQFTYPTPSVGSPGTEATEASHTGSWLSIAADSLDTLSAISDTTIKMEGTGSERYNTYASEEYHYASDHFKGVWHLEETSGTGAYISDSSGNGHGGTPTGTTSVTGIAGKARSFNGSSDTITISNESNFDFDRNAPMLISAWIKTSYTGGNQAIFSKQDNSAPNSGYELNVRTSGELRFHFYSNSSGSLQEETIGAVVNDGSWHHVAVRYGGTSSPSNVNIYVDGVQQSTSTISNTLTSTTLNNISPQIGSRNGATLFFNGQIDEVIVSNSNIGQTNIEKLYRMGKDDYINKTISSTDLSGKSTLPFYIAADRPGTYLQATAGESAYVNYQPDANTLAFWHLDETDGLGAYLLDSTQNNNHGDPTGTSFGNAVIGGGRSFPSGSYSDYIEVADSSTLQQATPLTVEAWFKIPSIPSANTSLIRKDTETGTRYMYGIVVNSGTGVLSAQYYNGSNFLVTTAESVADDKWHHAVSVISGTTISLYFDGIWRGSTTITGTQGVPTGRLNIGANPPYTGGAGASGLISTIDEVRISNVARSATQIRQAYEVGLRSHNITIDFAAALDSGNLIASSADLSFTVDATAYGLQNKGDKIYAGDKIIVKENYDGTEYIAQGTVTGVTASTGAVTVVAWDSGSTFPSGGFTANADVFKWQREYWPIAYNTLSTHMDAITNLSLRLTNGNEGRNIWIDDLKSNSNYLTDPTGSTITSSLGNRYMQYRAVITSIDPAVSATLSAVTVDYTPNTSPLTPSLDLPTDTATGQILLPVLKTTTTDTDSDYIRYKIELCENVGMSTNCQTFDQTSSQTGWSGQDAQTSTAYASGTQATYTLQTPLTGNTTYYWRSYGIDPGGTNSFGTTQGTPYSFTVNAKPSTPTLDSPTDTATGQPLLAVLKTTSTDAELDYLRYKIELCENVGMSTNCQTFDQTSSQTGWSGQDAQTSTAYASGTQATYTLQTPLTTNFTYYWRSYATDPAGSLLWSDTQTPYSFTTSVAPTAPTVPYAEGSTNPTGVADTTPEFSAIHNDPDGDAAIYYEIDVNTNNTFTGTVMWASGQTGVASIADSTRSPDISYAGTAIPLDGAGTTYYWRIRFTDIYGIVGAWSATQNFSMNILPGTPSLDLPADSATSQTTYTVLKTTATDTESDYLRYKIIICTNVIMTTGCQTFDQTVSQTGWSGQDAQTSTAYASGTQATYTIQTPLSVGVHYYWKSYAIDPGGSNNFGATQGTPYSFTTISSPVQPSACYVTKNVENTQLIINWTDNATNEEGYQVWRSVDGGLAAQLGPNLAIDTITLTDTDVSSGHSYSYLIRNFIYDGASTYYSNFCVTGSSNLNTGFFKLEGIQFN